ncbi:MAG: hypothetical protein ABFD83_07620 [Armatimonadota bacterium]
MAIAIKDPALNTGDPTRLGLKELPEHDYNLWMKPTLDGRNYVRH